jgi:hypothetical protein
MAIWYNLWPFGIVCDNLVYFTQFGMFGPRKIWQPWSALPTFVGGLVRKWRATKNYILLQGFNDLNVETRVHKRFTDRISRNNRA